MQRQRVASATGNLLRIMKSQRRAEIRVVVSVLTLSFLALLAASDGQVGETTTPTQAPPTEPTPDKPASPVFKPSDNIVTPEGEVAIDYEKGQPLPEELNDGELETGDQKSGWCYTKQSNWALEYPECKGAKMRQSPIDIVTDKVQFNPRMKMEFIDYDQQVEFELRNTHHSVSLTPIPSMSPPTVRLNWVPGDSDEFILQEIHFHWGDGINRGSEHEINDRKSAAEMHMVHYRKGVNKADIGSVENSVAVIGVLIEADVIEHHKLESLVRKAELVNGTDLQYIDDTPENLINLLPDNHHSFYSYNGSLTTPPCYEVVTWIIMSEPVFMKQERLVELSNLEAMNPIKKQRQKISANRRDIQPLLNRPVYVSFNSTDLNSEANLEPLVKQSRTQSDMFNKAFDTFWSQVNGLKTSVKRAFRTIGKARQKLSKQISSLLRLEPASEQN